MLPERSIVFVLTGEGWGKSAAALGYVLRSHGRGQRPVVVQFVKGEGWNVAERRAAEHLGIEWHTFGRGLTWAPDPSRSGAAGWSLAADLLRGGDHDLLVLDEIGNALAGGWVDLDAVRAALRGRASWTSVILTGREMPAEVCEEADIVTGLSRDKEGPQAGILT